MTDVNPIIRSLFLLLSDTPVDSDALQIVSLLGPMSVFYTRTHHSLCPRGFRPSKTRRLCHGREEEPRLDLDSTRKTKWIAPCDKWVIPPIHREGSQVRVVEERDRC